MSYLTEQEGFAESRFGTPAGFPTGSEASLVTSYYSLDTDRTEVVYTGLQVRTKAQNVQNVGDPVRDGYSFIGNENNTTDPSVVTNILVYSPLSPENAWIQLGRGFFEALSRTGEIVTSRCERRYAIFTPDGGFLSSAGSISLAWQQTLIAFNISSVQRVQFNGTAPYAYKTAGGAWGTLSDERLKQNIRPISDAIGKINALNPCHFEFKNSGESSNPTGTRTGFIAQEFEQVLPGHTFELEPMCDQDKAILGEGVKAKGIEADLVPYLVKATQELNTKLEQENLLLKQQLAALSARLDALEAK